MPCSLGDAPDGDKCDMRRVASTFTAEGGRFVGLWFDGGRVVALKVEGGRFVWLSSNGDRLFRMSFTIWLDVLLLLRFAFGGPCWLRLCGTCVA